MGGQRPADLLHIRLLGVFDAVVRNRAVEVGGPQQRAVLAILALEPGRTVPTERIVSRLWGESAPTSALNTLQSYVSRLRSVLEPDRPAGAPSEVIVGQAAGYMLAVEREQIDAFVFQRLAADGREALRVADHVAAESLLTEALALWRGPALTGVNGDGIASLAVRWEQERLNTIADLADAQLAIGHHDAAIAGLRDAVSHDPLHERLWTRLALALYRSGHQVDALRALADAREALAEASGLIAGPELIHLEAQILAHDPALLRAAVDATAEPRLASPRSTQRSGFVGRVAEWSELTARLDELEEVGTARQRHARAGGLVIIEGEAGIGKTTLLDAAADDARLRSWSVLRSRCHQDGLAPALWPWIEIVRQRGGDFAEVGLGSSMVEMSRIVADRLRPSLDDPALLVIIDDLHWADAATIDMLFLVAESLAGAPVLFAVGARPLDFGSDAPLARGLGALGRIAGDGRIRLTGMDRDDVAALITAISGRRPSSTEVESVHRRTGGNPLFIGELTRLSAGRHDAGGEPAHDGDEVPDLVRDVVRNRVARLPTACRDLLAAAAVVGDPADLRVLARAAAMDVVTCVVTLEPASDARIVVSTDSGGVRFGHAILREALLMEVSSLRRARLHLAAAEAIEHVFGNDSDHAEPIAVHRWHALAVDEPARVAGALLVAARAARRNGALARSTELVEWALAAAEHCPAGETRSTLEIDAMEMFLAIETSRSFMTTGLDDIADRIEELAERRGSDAAAQLARFTRWSIVNSSPVHLVEDVAAEALQAATNSDDPYVQIFGQYMWAVQRWLSADIDVACRHFELGLVAREALGAAAAARAGLSLGGLAALAFAQSGDRRRALECLEDEQQRTAAIRRVAVDGEGSFMASMLGVALADPDLVLSSTAAIVASRPSEFPLYMPACVVMNGWATAIVTGQDTTESMAKALAELETNGIRVTLSMLQTLHGETLLRVGAVAAAVDTLETARAEALTRRELFWLARTEALLAEAEHRLRPT